MTAEPALRSLPAELQDWILGFLVDDIEALRSLSGSCKFYRTHPVVTKGLFQSLTLRNYDASNIISVQSIASGENRGLVTELHYKARAPAELESELGFEAYQDQGWHRDEKFP